MEHDRANRRVTCQLLGRVINAQNMSSSSALCLSARTIVTVATPVASVSTRTLSSLTRRNLPRRRAGNCSTMTEISESCVTQNSPALVFADDCGRKGA